MANALNAQDQERTGPPLLACVILAHTDAVHVRRLVAALAPFPVFLHCDVSTSDDVFDEMTRDLPTRCFLLERRATGWAKWENVEAEIEGYRAFLSATDATHVALLTGADYPLISTSVMARVLGRYPGKSFASFHPLPYHEWGRSGGLSRLRYKHWAFRKRMLRLPVPRKIPSNIHFAGGSQLKVLARSHAETLVRTLDENPRLVQFFRRTWVADETFVGSILNTPAFQSNWPHEHLDAWLWYIGWDGSRRKSPPWLGLDDLNALRSARTGNLEVPRFFARKFSTAHDTAILDAIDTQLRDADHS